MRVSFIPWFMALTLVLSRVVTAAEADRWEKDIQAFEAKDRQGPAGADVLLFGSSSFRMWDGVEQAFPGVRVLNRGFGGSQLSDLLAYFERVVPQHAPRTLWVYGGDNDIAAGKDADRVVADFKQLVRLVHERLPRTRVVFFGVKPSPSREKWLPVQNEANRRIRRWAAWTPRVEYFDTVTPLLDSKGRPDPQFFIEDRLHLNRAGYERWEEAAKTELVRWSRR